MTRKIERLTAKAAGCWVDGHTGQYAVATMVKLAEDHGYRDDEICALAYRHLAENTPYDIPPLDDDEHEKLMDAADEVEAWMNEHLAPEGFSFGWHDGEFFLWANETWEEEG